MIKENLRFSTNIHQSFLNPSYINDYSYYYVNSDGAVVGKQGWILTSKGYVYVKADGTACTGVHVINGVTYYFGSDGIWIG